MARFQYLCLSSIIWYRIVNYGEGMPDGLGGLERSGQRLTNSIPPIPVAALSTVPPVYLIYVLSLKVLPYQVKS